MPKSRKKEKIKPLAGVQKAIIRIIAVLVLVSFSGSGLFSIGHTYAYFNNVIVSENNFLTAKTLDFYLESLSDFSPKITLEQKSGRDIKIVNNGSLNFEYNIDIEDISEDMEFCNKLFIKVFDNKTIFYEGELSQFNIKDQTLELSESKVFNFEVYLNNNDFELQESFCNFDFVFFGRQLDGFGFFDLETINNNVFSGKWENREDYNDKIKDVNQNEIKDINELESESEDAGQEKNHLSANNFDLDNALDLAEDLFLQNVVLELVDCSVDKTCDFADDNQIDSEDTDEPADSLYSLSLDLENQQTAENDQYGFSDPRETDERVENKDLQESLSAIAETSRIIEINICDELKADTDNYFEAPQPYNEGNNDNDKGGEKDSNTDDNSSLVDAKTKREEKNEDDLSSGY